MKKNVEFYSEGCLIKGHIYLPDNFNEDEKYPAIVLCHGFAGVKEILLPGYADAFSKNRFISLVFDYRGFGESEGERGKLSPINQVMDIRNAITYVESLNYIDQNKIGLWGTSYGGANAIIVASEDKRLKCLVVQLTFGNGERVITSNMTEMEKEKLLNTMKKLWIKKVTTNNDLLVPVSKVLTDEQSLEFYNKIIEEYPEFKIKIPMLTIKETLEHKPEKYLCNIDIPLLVVAAENDSVNPISESKSVYEKAKEPKELFILENTTHYQAYEGEKFNISSKKQIEWFNKYLKM